MKLFESGNIGRLQVKNRIVMAPLSTNFPNIEGEITPEFTEFYMERARGGVGLIILECSNVDYPLGKCGYTELRMDKDHYMPGMYQFIEQIHETGARIALQLNHAGGMFGDRDRSELDPVAPSSLVYGKNKRIARELTVPEIKQIQAKFIEAAVRCKMCGADAVELHGANGYLMASFLSPWTNKRTDEYGGSVENRARFAVEIVEAIRSRCGAAFPILFRISGDELVKGGRHLEETIEIVRLLKKAGIDCIHVSAGNHRLPHLPARRGHIEPMSVEQGWKTYLAREIRAQCGITTIAVGTIRDPEVAERIVNEDADFVAMARQLIADPRWPEKAAAGVPVRKCLNCNACVMHRSYYGGKLRCCVNPMAGVEYRKKSPELVPAATPRKVAVVGGGPAGMEAAYVAALRGHSVVLFEKENALGGNLIAAGRIDLKRKINWLTEWLSGELERLSVEVRLNCTADRETLIAEGFDRVVVAIGSQPRENPVLSPRIGEDGDTPIRYAIDVLNGKAPVPPAGQGSKAIVLGAGLVGCEAAYYLSQQGYAVTLIEGYRTKHNLISNTDQINGNELLCALGRQKIIIWDHAYFESLEAGQMCMIHNGQKEQLSCDLVVLALGQVVDQQARVAFEPLPMPVTFVGDVNGARTAFEAMHEGFLAGYAVE